MKVKVLKRFRDKYDHITRYEVGSEQEFETERAADLIERGLAELVSEFLETVEPVKKEEPAKAKKPIEDRPKTKSEK